MIALLQRVAAARVEVAGRTTGAIDRGLCVFLGVERGDDEAVADRLLERVVHYRVFPDDQDRMNLDLLQVGGGLLLVPQFTLAADTRKGNRPSFTPAAAPEDGARLFEYFTGRARGLPLVVATGVFGAHMQVTLTNDGPVTFWLRVAPNK